jgi:predicted permease
MIADLQYAVRQLARAPGFTLLVVVCLALGIGANVATFGAVDALLYRPPAGVHDPATLRRLRIEMPKTPGQQIFFNLGFSTPDVGALRARRETFASIAAYSEGRSFVDGGGFTGDADVTVVGPDYFGTLGVRPALGRLFAGAEASAGASAPVVVLGHAFWQRALGSDRSIVGRSLRVNGRPLTVVGVAAPGFGGTELQPAALFVPLGMGDLTGYAREQLQAPENKWLSAVARLAPGVDPRRAAAVAATVLKGVDAAQPRPVLGFEAKGGRSVQAPALHEYFAAGFGTPPIPIWLLGATGAVLVVVCANVANLLLLRAERRRREIATRLAIGAARGRVARQLFAEGLALALLGGALGLAVAAAGARLFQLVPSMPPIEGLIDARAVLFGGAVTLLTTLGFALAPALLATRGGAGELLRSGSRATTRRAPLRAALLVVQFAVSLALLGAGGLFVRSLRNVNAVDVGFDARRTLAVKVDWRAFGITPPEARGALGRARERVRGRAGVEHASLAMLAPFSGASMASLHVPGRASLDELSGVPGGMFFTNTVDTAYFRTLGVPVVRGRVPLPTASKTEREIAISETFERRVFPGVDPIGRCVSSDDKGSDCLRIVGIVRDARFLSVTRPPAPIFYRVVGEDGEGASTLLVRLRPDADPARVREGAEAVRAALVAAEPRIRFASVAPVADGMLRSALAPYRLAATTFTAFGVLALLLAAVGLYGVVAYAVTQRTNEFGIRMALGARAVDVRRLVLRQGVRTALVGGAVGAGAAVAIGRALRSRLYGVDPLDPVSLLVVGALLATVTLVAAWLPARRASRVDPVVALRAE